MPKGLDVEYSMFREITIIEQEEVKPERSTKGQIMKKGLTCQAQGVKASLKDDPGCGKGSDMMR